MSNACFAANLKKKRFRKKIESRKPFVSLVVPGFNESAIVEKNLARLCDYMGGLEDSYRWELIFVNDGSSDKTGEIAERFAEGRSNITVLHHGYNFRLGQAFRYAFANCRGDYIITLDLDLSYSEEHIERMLDKLIDTRAKVVVASPYKKGGMVSNVPWLRKVLSKWANRFLSLTITNDDFSDNLTTVTGMVRAYDAHFLRSLNLKAMGVDIHPEILYKAMILRARIVEIPAHLNWEFQLDKSVNRTSSMRIARSIISNVLSGFIFRPFMFFVVPGILLMLVSFYCFFFVFYHVFTSYPESVSIAKGLLFRFGFAVASAFEKAPHAFVIAGISMIISIQLISLGILSLQNKKYFEELFHLGTTLYKGGLDVYNGIALEEEDE